MENEDQLNERSRASSTSSNIERIGDNYSQAKGGQLVFSPSMMSKPNVNNANNANDANGKIKTQKMHDDLHDFKLDGGSSFVDKKRSVKTKDRAKSPTACNELIGSSPKQLSASSNSPKLGNPYQLDGSHNARKKAKSATKQRVKDRENKLKF